MISECTGWPIVIHCGAIWKINDVWYMCTNESNLCESMDAVLMLIEQGILSPL